MKRKILAALLLLGSLLIIAACGTGATTSTTQPGDQLPPAPNKYLVIVSGEDFSNEPHISKQVEVNAGDSFSLALDSNVTTGFQWAAQANISDKAVLEQTAHNYIAPNTDNETTVVGMAGLEEWTFKALKTGTATVDLSYSRPWEGGEKGVRTFELSVTVK